MKKAFLIIIGVLLLPIVMGIPTFHHFYGSVVDVNGSLVNDTLNIVAYINGSSYGGIIATEGAYGYSELFFIEDGSNGDIIEFYVDGYASVNYTFTNEGATELNLVLNESGEDILCGNGMIDCRVDTLSPTFCASSS